MADTTGGPTWADNEASWTSSGSMLNPGFDNAIAKTGASAREALGPLEKLHTLIQGLGRSAKDVTGGTGGASASNHSSPNYTVGGAGATISGKPLRGDAGMAQPVGGGTGTGAGFTPPPGGPPDHGRGGHGGGNPNFGMEQPFGAMAGARGITRLGYFYAGQRMLSGLGNYYNTNVDYAQGLREQTARMGGAWGMDAKNVERSYLRNTYKWGNAVVRGPADMQAALPIINQQMGGMGRNRGVAEALTSYFSRSELSASGGAQIGANLMAPEVMNNLRGWGIAHSFSDLQNPERIVEEVMKVAANGRTPTLNHITSSAHSSFRANLRHLVGAENEMAFINAALDNRGRGPLEDNALAGILKQESKRFGTDTAAVESNLQVQKLQLAVLTEIRTAVQSIANGYPAAMAGGLASSPLVQTGLNLAGQAFLFRGGGGGASAAAFKAARSGGAGLFRSASSAASALTMGGKVFAGGLAATGASLIADPVQRHITGGHEGGARDLGGGIAAGALRGAGIGAMVGNLIPIPGVGAGIGAAVGAVAGGIWGGISNRMHEGDPPSGSAFPNTPNTGAIGSTIGAGPQDNLDLRTDKDPSHIVGLDPTFRAKLAAMFRDNPKLYVYSGKRSSERQKQLWEEAKAKYGSEAAARKWVAPPAGTRLENGTIAVGSNHERGLAADLAPASEYGWIKSNAGRYGLTVPLSNEPWHVEPAGLRTGAEQVAMQGEASPATNAISGMGGVGGNGLSAIATRSSLVAGESAHIAAILAGGGSGFSLGGGGGGVGAGGISGGLAASAAGTAGGIVGGEIGTFMAAIRRLESGSFEGKYDAQGALITNKNSQYYGEKAYGAYQIMPGNWEAWSKEAGIPGASLQDPAAQDTVARYKFGKLYEKYKRWDAVAVEWFAGGKKAREYLEGVDLSGTTDAQAGKKGTSVPQYVDLINKYMGQYSSNKEGDPPSGRGGGGGGGGGARMVYNGGAKNVTINVYTQGNSSDAHALAKRVQRILREEDDFSTVGSS